jgi:hypothetical protein
MSMLALLVPNVHRRSIHRRSMSHDVDKHFAAARVQEPVGCVVPELRWSTCSLGVGVARAFVLSNGPSLCGSGGAVSSRLCPTVRTCSQSQRTERLTSWELFECPRRGRVTGRKGQESGMGCNDEKRETSRGTYGIRNASPFVLPRRSYRCSYPGPLVHGVCTITELAARYLPTP